MPSTPTLLKNGKPAGKADAEKAPVILVDAREPEAVEVHLFSGTGPRDRWARKNECFDSVRQLEELAARALKARDGDLRASKKRQKEVVDRVTRDLESLARSTGLPVNSPKLFRLATTAANPIEGPVFDPAIIYEHINRGGAWRPLGGGLAYPDFRWIAFNDVASSILITGYLDLFSNIWFGGRRLNVIGPGRVLPPAALNLTAFGFNDVASSAVCI